MVLIASSTHTTELLTQKLLAKILAATYDPTANIVMVISITIMKTLNIHDSVKKIIYAAGTYDIATVININKTFGIHATMFLAERI